MAVDSTPVSDIPRDKLNDPVAVEVMGWNLNRSQECIGGHTWYAADGTFGCLNRDWSPATDSVACEEVKAKLRDSGRFSNMQETWCDDDDDPSKEPMVVVELFLRTDSFSDDPSYGANGKTSGEAWCRAALMAVREVKNG